jgi:YD repeat-containing protein
MKIKFRYLLLSLLFLTTTAFAGSIDLATGSHTQDFELFDTGITGLPSTMTLYYESRTGYQGPLGKKWTHTFDLYLRDDVSTMLQKDIYGDRYMYDVDNGKYKILGGRDISTLVKERDGSFTLKRDNLTYRYDKDRQLTMIIDPIGAKTLFTFSEGKLAKVVTPENKAITFAYGDAGRLSQVTRPDGNKYTIEYNGPALSAIIYPDGGTWRFNYTPSPQLYMLTKTNPKGETTTYDYADNGWVISATTHTGETQYVEYPDKTSTVRSATMIENGKVTDYTFDVHERTLARKVDPDGGVTTYTHDAAGNITSETDPAGRTTSYTYDEQKRMTSLRDPDGNVTTYKYDRKGNLIEITDSKQRTIRNEYDASGRLTKTTDPDGKSLSYTYDSKGNLTSIKGPDGAFLQVPADAQQGGVGRE